MTNKWLAGLLFLAPLLSAQQPSTTETEPVITGSIDLGYRWRTAVAGSFETYRSIVDFGSGPKFLGTDFTVVDPHQKLFDRVEVRAYGWGDEPYATLHVRAQKSKWYDFNGDYRDIAYFNNIPSFADPLLARGVVLNEQSYDTRRRLTSLQLDLLPGNWLIPYLAFDRSSDTGTGVNAFVADSNEYPVPVSIRNSVNIYRGGVRLQFRRIHLTLEQGGVTFKDDQRDHYSASVPNYGNNPTTLLGQTPDLTSLSEAYGIRGTSIYSKALLTASPVSWIDLYGQFLLSRPDNTVNFQQSATGTFLNLSQLTFSSGQQYLLSAEAQLPHTTESAGAEIRPLRRVRILEYYLSDKLGGGATVTSPALLSSALVTHYNREQIDLLIDATAKLTLRGGYRYVWGDGSDVILPIAELAGFEKAKLRQNVAVAAVTYRPTQKISVNGEIEDGSSGGAYFRTSLYNYQKIRARARYRVTSALQITADSTVLNNQNPTPGINYDYFAHQESASLLWSPTAAKGWTTQASYTRSTLRSDINYLVPQSLQPERDYYRDNSHIVGALFEGALPKVAGRAARLSVGGSFFLSSGSRPTSFYQPVARLSVPLHAHFSWISEWRYDGYGESFTNYENFRTHLVTTGLRLTR